MQKKASDQISLRDLSRAELDESDADAFLAELTTGTDRAAALVASTVLDNDIASILEMVLVHKTKKQLEDLLYSPQAPLSGFSARIKMIYAIGIIEEKVFVSLNVVRNVRNTFAHAQKPLKFDTPAIARECAKLPATHVNWSQSIQMTDARRRYIEYCVTLSSIMRTTIPRVWGDRPNLWALAHVKKVS